jgi:hypothetical protein
VHLTGYSPIEGWRIDDNGKIGLSRVGIGDQLVEETPDFRQVAQDLGDSDHREIFTVYNYVASGGSHRCAAHSEEFDLGIAAVKSHHELRAIHFTGRLTSGDQNSHRAL